MTINYGSNFLKKLKKYKSEDGKRYKRILVRIELFGNDIKHPSLRIHKLSGKYGDYWSFSIEQDLRIIYYYTEKGIVFVNIGNHREVYK